MVVKEFHASLVILLDFFQKTNLVARFSTFANSLKGQGNKLTPQELQKEISPSFDTMLDLLIDVEASTGIPLDGSAFLRLVGLEEVLSVASWEALRRQFKAGGIDQAIKVVGEYEALLQSRVVTMQTMLAAFKKLGMRDGHDFYERQDDEVLISLRFNDERRTQISDVSATLTSLKKHLEFLSRIDNNPRARSFRVVSLSKASPLCVEIVAYSSLGIAINKIISGMLDNANKVQEIRKKQQEIKTMKLANEHEEAILEKLKAAEAGYAESSDTIKDEVLRDVPAERMAGSQAEIEKAVSEACGYFKDVLEAGTEIRVYLTAANKTEGTAAQHKKALIASREKLAMALKATEELRRVGDGSDT
ncbi:MAG TPA: hypothetical protein VJP80_03125 [Candidatus Saccharimonadales bacterium]|nr:hypothetical protein [Candidatus Saccharimonadales bacterium]